jgi:hypothetical protein
MKDWLKDNIANVIALFVAAVWGFCTCFIMYTVKDQNTLVTIYTGSVTIIFAGIVGYWFKSSSGSAKKTEILEAQSKTP